MFPAPASVTAYAYAFGTALMGIAGVFLVDDKSSWALGWDISLVAVLYNVSAFPICQWFQRSVTICSCFADVQVF